MTPPSSATLYKSQEVALEAARGLCLGGHMGTWEETLGLVVLPSLSGARCYWTPQACSHSPSNYFYILAAL